MDQGWKAGMQSPHMLRQARLFLHRASKRTCKIREHTACGGCALMQGDEAIMSMGGPKLDFCAGRRDDADGTVRSSVPLPRSCHPLQLNAEHYRCAVDA
jgi:hypothetical protein